MESLGELRWAAIQFVALILCIALHEFGHAWAADKRGDPLPRLQGRVTLNPVAHIDPLGTLLLPGLMIFGPIFFGGMPFGLIGWGKPVQISLPNAKTRKKDEILVTLAGPGMNFALALLSALVLGLLVGFNSESIPPDVYTFFLLFIMMNCGLGVFNLMPLPPLDGSHLMRYAVGMKEETYYKLARNAWWILLLAINIPPGNPILLMIFRPIVETLALGFLWISEIVAQLF